ncbi:extracellular solute-binding protein [Halalkalibacter alkaliphilus]|uniref:Extracellular solute-binding protein n=1 Tax=Halalkalibacter alkaliphilus TaxID=2917993 RepID=A0A9X2I584_9BACI|nr:extracellular solute-binding protein [Halalkalibacter alkaliphilus]MCL7748476.1 extracellular solute-binding protein [Halalkalibacter alkaliphilus]
MQKWLSSFCILVLISNLIGCSWLDNRTEDEVDEKTTINIMIRSYTSGGWNSNHPVIQELNKRLGMELNIEWVPTPIYEEKLNVAAASNKFPDVFFVTNDQFLRWRDRGVFMDVKPYISDYPNLFTYIPETAYQLYNPEDQYFGFPVYIPEVLESIVIRKDWLDTLGLEMPETVDEFYEVAKVFVNEDPNNSGNQDTIGFTLDINPMGNFGFGDTALFFMAGFGLVNGWGIDDNGKLFPMQIQTNEIKDFIGFLRKAYAEGVLDPDFLYNLDNDSYRMLQGNQLGIARLFHTVSIPALVRNSPEAELVQLSPLIGPNQERGIFARTGKHKIVINANIDLKKQEKILGMLDYMLSDEGHDLLSHGIEGIHYARISDDNYQSLEAAAKDAPSQLLFSFLRRNDPKYMILKTTDAEEAAALHSFTKNNEKYLVNNPAVGLVSKTEITIGTTINNRWMETMVNVIKGEEPMEAIEKAVEEWKSTGGKEIITEINEAYQQLNKTMAGTESK